MAVPFPIPPLLLAIMGGAFLFVLAGLSIVLPLATGVRQAGYERAVGRDLVRLEVILPANVELDADATAEPIRALHPGQRRGVDWFRVGWPPIELRFLWRDGGWNRIVVANLFELAASENRMDGHLDRGHHLRGTFDLPVHDAVAPEKAQFDQRPADAEPIDAAALARMEGADQFGRCVGVEFDVRRQDDLQADEFAAHSSLVSGLANSGGQWQHDREAGENEQERAAHDGKQERRNRKRYGHRVSSFRRQDCQWIDRNPGLVNGEVQVRPRRDTSHAYVTQDLACHDGIADLHRRRILEMPVEGDDVGQVLDLDDDCAARVSPGEDDLPARYRSDRRAEGSGDVDAAVEVRV